MAVPSPLALNQEANRTPAIDGAGVALAGVRSLHGGGVDPMDDTTWLEAASLRALFGRGISGLGVSFLFEAVNSAPIPAFPLPYGPESLADLLYEICTVQILLGRNPQQELPASIFRDTRKLQRILEIPIRPPMPESNNALRFRIVSPMPLPSGDLAAYNVTTVFHAYFPPNGTEPATMLRPTGLGLVRV